MCNGEPVSETLSRGMKKNRKKEVLKVKIEQEMKTERKELLFWALINRSYWYSN